MHKLVVILSMSLFVLGVTTAVSSPAQAAELKTITLSVDKMTCSLCKGDFRPIHG